MRDPKWQDVQLVADRFFLMSQILGEDNCKVNIGNPKVLPEANLCGTPACHAGWYAAFNPNMVMDRKGSYCEGVRALNNDLGFKSNTESSGHSLREWAWHNPELWGNVYGYCMFSSNSAFGRISENLTDDILTLVDIAKHWQGVANRLCEKQRGD